MILEVNGINTFYGTSHILFGISMEVEKGESVCLLGRNGAGRTTTLRSIVGIVTPSSGSIKFKGEDIVGKPPYIVSRRGIGFVPEDRKIFPSLTAREQLEVAQKKGIGNWTISKIYDLFPHLKNFERHMGNQLSGGEQQMLTIARTLMGNPELLILDEPTEGLAPLIVLALMEQIRKLKEEKITLLISDMGLRFAVELSTRAYIIDMGRNKWSGTCEELKENEDLKTKYLLL
jgi:branched-chain amino acid transport system ATP-binding protein